MKGYLFWGSLVCGFAGCTPAATEDVAGSSTLVVSASVDVADIQNREPMLVELADGTLLVSGFPRLPHEPARAPSLWRSGDGGQSWERADVGTPVDGAIGNSDVDLAVAPDGTVYFATMGFNRTDGVGTHISVGVSRDGGSTWTWNEVTDDPLVDRPWIDVARDGAVHLIWNDDLGVRHAVSTDRGGSWAEQARVHPEGGSSHLALGPNGELAVRIGPIAASGNVFHEGVDLIAVSRDGGTTWSKHPAPGNRSWEGSLPGSTGLPRWVEPLAWDASGSLLHLWSEGTEIWLGRSTDQAATWSLWPIESHAETAYYPFLVPGPDGQLAATWFSGTDDLRVNVAVIRPQAESDEPPEVVAAEPIQPRSWLEVDGELRADTAGEYAVVRFLSDGDLGVVTPLQDPTDERFGFTWWRFSRQ